MAVAAEVLAIALDSKISSLPASAKIGSFAKRGRFLPWVAVAFAVCPRVVD